MAADGTGWPADERRAPRRPVFTPEDGVSASRSTEQALLSAVLGNPKIFEALPERFGPHHFVCMDHADIFEAAQEAAQGGGQSGVTHIAPRVEALLPHLAGGEGYVRELLKNGVSYLVPDALLYAQTLMDLTERRELLSLAEDIRLAASAPISAAQPTSAIVARTASALDQIAAGQRQAMPATMLGEAMTRAIHDGEAAAANGGMAGISTGFNCIDRRLGGLEGASVYLFGGRPGMGKTAIGTDIGLNVAEDDIPVAIISLEMKAQQIGRRVLSTRSGVPLMDIKTGRFATERLEDGRYMADAVMEARARLADLPLIIEDEPSLTVGAILLRAKAARRRLGGLGLLIIDHLHIVGRSDTAARHGDTQAVTEVSGGIKRIAKLLDVPVIILAQLNRGPEGREDKRPGLADLRQSGSIEQDVDAAMFIYRPEYYLAKQVPERKEFESAEKFTERQYEHARRLADVQGRAEILSEKVRDGEPGVDFIRFDGKRTRFYEEGEDRA